MVTAMRHDSLQTSGFALAFLATSLSLSGPTWGDQNRYNVPPPAGYQPSDEQYETSVQARADDETYSYKAEHWAARNCVAERANNTAAGAVIGGLLGAIVGSGLAGRHARAGGAIAGGAVGALAGSAIGSASTYPGCPPGYVLRPHPEPFAPVPVYTDVIYQAPPWYDPWIWYGGHWIFRPYPFHRYWYRVHRR
jgi:hypothetical protein